MPAAPLPANEPERLRALKLYRLLDAGSEQAFDQLTRLATAICGTSSGLVTVVARDQQRFLSHIGFEAQGTSRDVAFCAHAILRDELLIVEDATRDSRFADNPMVTSAPGIRFYAGAPLTVGDGIALGTLCVLDSTPHTLNETQVGALSVLRDAVVTQLKLRRALDDLQAIEQVLPMCAWCRSIRTADDRWRTLDQYVMEATTVSHGICPECSTGMGYGSATAAATSR